MKAEELRIGNCLDGRRGFVVIEEIRKDRCMVKVEDSTSSFIVGGEAPCLTPIPLTEEWLLKLGFSKIVFDSDEEGYRVEYRVNLIDDKDYIVVFDDMSVGTYSNGDMAHVIYPIKQHVHTLQNLYFALTGEELKLKQNESI